jgi:hypothetical protein
MKKTGSEIAPDESEQSKAPPAEPVERARLQADVAKQRVRIAKEELKRARKRLKEAKREARRARKQAAAAHKEWKQERRASKDAVAKKPATPGKAKKSKRRTASTAAKKSKPATKKNRKAVAPAPAIKTPAAKNKTKAKPTVKRASVPAAKRTVEKSRKRTNGATQNSKAAPADETQAPESFATTPAANSEELGTLDGATNGAAVEHGT